VAESLIRPKFDGGKDMKIVRFPMYFEVFGYQELVLPDYIDSNDEDAVREYIADSWEHIKLPSDTEYVGDSGFDFESPIEILKKE